MKILLKFHQQVLLIASLVFLFTSQTNALNYYWVGGSGNWTDLSHWATTSGGTTLHNQIPTAVDDVFFDANSFSMPGQTINLDPLTILTHDMNWTGVTNTPILSGSAINLLKVYGSLTFVPGMNVTFTGNVNFEATAPGKTITMGGQSFTNSVSLNGIGGVWTLLDAFTTAGSINFTSGIFNTNNKIVNTRNFAASTTTTKTLNMGSSVFNVTGTWNVDPAATINCGTSTVNLTSAAFTGGNHTYYDLNFTDISFGSSGSIADGNNFHDVVFDSKAIINMACNFHNVFMRGDGEVHGNNVFNDLTLTAGHTYSLENLATQTINGTLHADGNCEALIAINSFVQGSQATISHPAGIVNGSFLVLKDIRATGGGNFTANSSVDLGNNTGWTINPLSSQNLYWIGNSGNWDDGNHWSFTSGGAPSGCSPTPFDNVFFDANSFSIAGQTVVLNPFTAYCNDMTWTGVTNTPTLTGPYPNLLKIYGSLRFVSGMILNFNGLVNFEAIATGKTISMGGNSFHDNVTFNGVGGGWTLLDEFTTVGNITLNNGTLNSNDQTVNALEFTSISSTVRALNMGASVFNITGNNLCWSVTQTGMTLNCGTSTVNCTNGASPNFSGGNFTYYDLNFPNPGATGNIVGNNVFHDVVFTADAYIFQANNFHNVTMLRDGQIQANNNYNNLTFTAGHTYILFEGTAQAISGVFTAIGNCGALIDIHSPTPGSQAIISHPAGSVNISYVVLKDILATGGATFTASNSVDLGDNTGWIINPAPAQNLYWINDTGNWDDGNHWSLTSGGPPVGCSPTPLDNVFFDANSFSAAGQSVTIDPFTAYCHDMTWTGVTNMPTLGGVTPNLLKIYGSLTFVAAMNLSFAGPVDFEAITPGKTIHMGGQSFNNQVKFNGIGGEWTLQDVFTTTNRITLNNGTLNTNNQIVNALEFYTTSSSTRALNMGSSVFNLYSLGVAWSANATGMTLNCGTSIINCTDAVFLGGTLTYYDLNFTDASSSSTGIIQDANHFHDVFFASKANISHSNIFNNVFIVGDAVIDSNNVYHDLRFNSGHTYTLKAGGTQTINNRWQVQGSCISYIVLQSSVPGLSATINKSAGSVLGYNIHIKDMHCVGGANFIAYNSVDLGGNTGWSFSTLPALQNPDIIGGPSPICSGATGVVYHIAPVQGAIYYEWTVPAGATIVSGQGDTLIVVDFGTATSGNIVVQSFNGCNYGTLSSTFGLVLSGQLTPSVTLTADPGNSICSGTIANFIATATNGGSATVTYNFILNGSSVQTGSSNIYSNGTLSTGDQVSCNISLSGTSCYAVTTATSNIISITVEPGGTATVSIEAIPSGPICSGTPVKFTATGSNSGSGNITYNFKVNGISVQNGASNVYTSSTLSNADNVSCDITITGGTCLLSGNASSNKITIDSKSCDCDPGVPNAITPNGDGINDKWIISHGNNCIFKVAVSVYNRYGSLVYHSDDYQDDWEGTYKSKTCPDGTYYYVLKTIYPNRHERVFRGDITILR